jgi:hypothetical protein
MLQNLSRLSFQLRRIWRRTSVRNYFRTEKLKITTERFEKGRDSAVGIATGQSLNDSGVGVRVLKGSKIFLLHVVQTGFKVHPTPYPMGTGDYFPAGKAAEA